MGLFKKIGKAFKSVGSSIGKLIGGAKKGFKSVLKSAGKFLGSDVGKVLMVGLTIFSLGSALPAAAAAFNSQAAGASFFTKFVAGGKAFLGALVGKAQVPGTPGGGIVDAAVGPATSFPAGTAAADLITESAVPLADVAAGGAGVAGSAVNAAAAMTQPNWISGLPPGMPGAAKVATDVAKPGLLSRAATGAWDFAKSPGGGQVLGNALQGYGAAKAAEEVEKDKIKEARRFEQLWSNLDNSKLGKPGMFNIQVPNGFMTRAQNVSNSFAPPPIPLKPPTQQGS